MHIHMKIIDEMATVTVGDINIPTNFSASNTDTKSNKCQGFSSVESFCKCTASANFLNGMPATAARIWKSPLVQDKLRQVTLESLKRCWWFVEPKQLDLKKIDSYTNEQLKLLDPVRLKSAIRTPAHPAIMQKVLEIILKRIQDPINNPGNQKNGFFL